MSEWISVNKALPSTHYEMEEFDSTGEVVEWHGMVSDCLEISDGQKLARGYMRSDFTWNIFDAEHDFQIVDENDVTHWMPLPTPPDYD